MKELDDMHKAKVTLVEFPNETYEDLESPIEVGCLLCYAVLLHSHCRSTQETMRQVGKLFEWCSIAVCLISSNSVLLFHKAFSNIVFCPCR
jgi:hypothetical protein